jgi:FdhE protein
MARMLTEALKTIEHYKTTTPHYEELLDILSEILILREDYRQQLTDTIFPVEDSLIAAKMEGGLPLVDLTKQEFDLSTPKQYFMNLLEIGLKRVPKEATEIIEQIDAGDIEYEKMIYESFASVSDDELEDGDMDDETFDLLQLFVEESLRPFLEMVTDKYRDIICRHDWSEGYCPVCGREPKIGEIKDEEGKRVLFCNQCGFEWNFRRIKCPFCGNEEQQTLAYFTVEEDERYRVDVCNECHRYIKIVDFRETGKTADLDVEDIATLHLDMLANEEGYH